MKNLIIFLSLVISSSIFSQSRVIVSDFIYPPVPIDTNFNPFNGKIETKNVFYAKGNDIDKNGHYLDENNINEYNGKNKLDNTNFNFIIDNHSVPSELTILNSNFKIKLTKKQDIDFESLFSPFATSFIDSVVFYKTEYDFFIEFEYIGQNIVAIQFFFDKNQNDKIYLKSKNWFNSLTINEKSILGKDLNDNKILNIWIENNLLGSTLNENFIENEKFSIKFTNKSHYVMEYSFDE